MCIRDRGIAATLTHVIIAWIAYQGMAAHPAIANLMGAGVAFVVSLLGNEALTFRSGRSAWKTGPRYLLVSLVSYLLTTGIMMVVHSHELPTYIFAIAVLVIVPPTTFLLAKFWAFSTRRGQRTNELGGASCV